MPRNVNPGTIQVGKGLAPEGTVEDNSLRYPERDVDPLRVHIHDPSRAHMAETIGIKDEGDCYTSDDVEGALLEKVYLLETILQFIDTLFERFLKIRVSPEWDQHVVPEIRKWIIKNEDRSNV